MSSTTNKIKGRAYRVLVDNTPGAYIWNQLSLWTHAQDVEFNDGNTAQSKVGDINGITTSTSVTEAGFAADASVVSSLYTRVNQHVSATLVAGSTELVFTNSSFGSTTHFEVWTNVFGVDPTDMTLSGTTLTLTFPEQENDVTVQVFYFNL